MNEIKKFFVMLKKLWINKRTRAAAIFIMYLLLILILIIFIRTNKDDLEQNINEENNIQIEEEQLNNNLKFRENYNYDIQIILNTLEKYKINSNNNTLTYYIYNQNSNNYDVISELPQNIINLDLEYILYLINKTEVEYTTEYKDNTKLNNYNLIYNNKTCSMNVKYDSQNIIAEININFDDSKYNIIF